MIIGIIVLTFFLIPTVHGNTYGCSDSAPKKLEGLRAPLLFHVQNLKFAFAPNPKHSTIPTDSAATKFYPIRKKDLCRPKNEFNGKASFYGKGDSFAGKLAANGKIFDPSKLTAAHKTLPFGTRVRVFNKSNKKSVIVTITDRGPFKPGRVLDLSYAAAKKLDFEEKGITEVDAQVCLPPSS
jgi:rare lipoprotein A (peptidoglycan hydrolase)